MKPEIELDRFAQSGRRLVHWTRAFLLLAGVLALSYVALTLLHARSYENDANNTLDRQIHAEEYRQVVLPRSAVKEGDVLGRIEIPRLGLKLAILEGTTTRTLRLGAGHIAGTALPGSNGNIGIAGHRDTWFRALKDIRAHDQIQIQTAAGLSRYEVDWVQIVDPADTSILALSTGSAVTLVTCYPFHYIGAAPERYIVHARIVVRN